MILCLRADSPEVYLGLWKDGLEIIGKSWQAGRELSTQILDEIRIMCDNIGIPYDRLNGYIVYEGPGSYTGLRISMSVANALAYSYQNRIVSSTGENWIAEGLTKLNSSQGFKPILPVYGGEVFTTKPKK